MVVMLYVRHPLSLRNVEDLLSGYGIDICHETVRVVESVRATVCGRHPEPACELDAGIAIRLTVPVFSSRPDLEVASAGTNHDAVNPLTSELLSWADVVVVTEKVHRSKLQKRFRSALNGKD